MAVNATHESSRLALVFQVGQDAQSNPILKTKGLARVRPTATQQDVFDVATALAGLQTHTLNSIGRIDNFTLESA